MSEKVKLESVSAYDRQDHLPVDDVDRMIKLENSLPITLEARMMLYALGITPTKQLKEKAGPGRGQHLYPRAKVDAAISYMKVWYEQNR